MHKLYSLLIIFLLIPCCSLFSEPHFKIKTIQISHPAIWCANRMDISIKKKIEANYYYNSEHYYIQNFSSEKFDINNEDQNDSETKGWKKPLIIAGELAGAFFVGHVTASATYSLIDNSVPYEEYEEHFSYFIGETLGTSCSTLIMGKLFHQNGSTKGALIGSVIGTAIGCGGLFLVLGDNEEYGDGFVIGNALAVISPSIGSVIGYNIK